MCGIFGYIGSEFSIDTLIDGIRRLEYRGYDSWGIAVNSISDHKLLIQKAKGRISDSVPRLRHKPLGLWIS